MAKGAHPPALVVLRPTPGRDLDDGFRTFAGVSEETWRELLARGHRYGVGLTLAHQHPSQLPQGLQNEFFGNVASLVALNVSAKDARAVRREFLERRKMAVLRRFPRKPW